MDIVWLKRDVRLTDHAPLYHVSRTRSRRPLVILYNYEPDQLSEHSVHGSHVHFINEGLVDLDRRLSGNYHDDFDYSSLEQIQNYKFQVLTVCHAGVVFTLQQILNQTKSLPFDSGINADDVEEGGINLGGASSSTCSGGIHEILTHEETGHLKSFARDKTVRRWCKHHAISIHEYNQTGVTRCLKDRDEFSTIFNAFVHQKCWDTPTKDQLSHLRSRVKWGMDLNLKLHQRCTSPIDVMEDLKEIPVEHRTDRIRRQTGGEGRALLALESFLNHRGKLYAQGISSPNTSWNSGGRISPYLTWGHISTRYVIQKLKHRQEELRLWKKNNTKNKVGNIQCSDSNDGPWLRSLAAFSSRIHWRSHFIQKLESEPDMERRDLCSAYQHLRRQPNDWNEAHYQAWSTGTTGFPFVDASMRCLLQHGWINFRMRAMLVSFATYNLWLDWKRIAPHLARVFLDYEPGIHYPQLQMQSGTTGINAMRVYNVTKQGIDQDPKGTFIKKYVEELRNVPVEYIHEPSKMSESSQLKYKICIGNKSFNDRGGQKRLIQLKDLSSRILTQGQHVDEFSFSHYPQPIVDEKQTAKVAKEKVNAVKKQGSTRRLADQVYIKHGSRKTSTMNADMQPKALSSKAKRLNFDSSQMTLKSMFRNAACQSPVRKKVKVSEDQNSEDAKDKPGNEVIIVETCAASRNSSSMVKSTPIMGQMRPQLSTKATPLKVTIKKFTRKKALGEDAATFTSLDQKEGMSTWSCVACTFLNDKPFALSCIMCGTIRK